MNTVDDLRKLEYWTLAEMADCAAPHSNRTVGAAFLVDVRDAFVEELERFDREEDNDVIHEIASRAPDIYTYRRWQEFVDLGAWLEEPESGEWGTDELTDIAGIALFQIAERLCQALLNMLREEDDDTE